MWKQTTPALYVHTTLMEKYAWPLAFLEFQFELVGSLTLGILASEPPGSLLWNCQFFLWQGFGGGVGVDTFYTPWLWGYVYLHLTEKPSKFLCLQSIWFTVSTCICLWLTLTDGNTCFYGVCHYCKKSEAACANDTIMEGSITIWLPSGWSLSTSRHPWQRTYREGRKAQWVQFTEWLCIFPQVIRRSQLDWGRVGQVHWDRLTDQQVQLCKLWEATSRTKFLKFRVKLKQHFVHFENILKKTKWLQYYPTWS